MKYKIDTIFPTRNLSANENNFLSGLSAYTLDLKKFFGKSISFCIDDLQLHTELVLSGLGANRQEFSSRKELEKEIEELEGVIKRLEEKFERGELSQEEWLLREILQGQLGRLKEVLEKNEYKTKTTCLLGLYEHNGGHDSRVTLFVNNIEHVAGHDRIKTMYLMGQVLLHEYFHSFYYHTGGGLNPVLKYAEEPMAELGSLVVLDSVATSGLLVSPWASNALPYALDFVKGKQKCVGMTAAYGFGAYMYSKLRIHVLRMIALYARVSRLINGRSMAALEYKYLVYPQYPQKPWIEELAYKKLVNLLVPYDVRSVGTTAPVHKVTAPPISTSVSPMAKKKIVVREKGPKDFAINVFHYIEKHGLLYRLDPYIKIKIKPTLKALSDKTGNFNLSGTFCDNPVATPRVSDWDCTHTFNMGGNNYYISKEWYRNGKRRSIEELKKMIEYVYSNLTIEEIGDEFILWEY